MDDAVCAFEVDIIWACVEARLWPRFRVS